MCLFVCLFVCFVALRPKSTAMVMAGRSVHLTILFLGKLEQAVNQYFVHILSLVTDKTLLECFSGREKNDRRKYFMINLCESIGLGRIELATPGSAVRHASVARHITGCATHPGPSPLKCTSLL